MWFKAELDQTQRTHLPLSDFLLVLCGRILLDRFQAPDTSWKTTSKPSVSNHNFLSNSSWALDRADDAELCYKFG